MEEVEDTQESETPASEDVTDLVNDTVLYILGNDNSFAVIKRQDITKNILKERKKYFSTVIKGVKSRLSEDFGFDLIDIEPNKQYVLVNRLNSPLNTFPTETEADRALIVLVLTLIFMNNGVMAEEQLSSLLKRLRIMTENSKEKKHDFFGDVENSIKKKFVRWAYLECNEIRGTDPPLHEFRWGKRAKDCVSKKQILELACQIIGDTQPEDWDKQYSEANQQDNLESRPSD